MTPTLDTVLRSLRSHRFTFATERELQDGIAEALRSDGLPCVEEEARLDARCRIDLLVGRVGIEVKVDGGWRDVLRQVIRYASFEQIDAVVLVTTKPMHRRLPAIAHGKPIVVHLAGSVL